MCGAKKHQQNRSLLIINRDVITTVVVIILILPDSALVWRMSKLTRDGTAEPVLARAKSLVRTGRREKYSSLFSGPRTGLTAVPVADQSAVCDDYTYIHACIHTYSINIRLSDSITVV